MCCSYKDSEHKDGEDAMQSTSSQWHQNAAVEFLTTRRQISLPPPFCSSTASGSTLPGKLLKDFYLTGNEQHKVSLIATSQEMLLQRETRAFPRKKKKNRDFFFFFFFFFLSPPSTCRDKPPLEAPKYLLLSVKSRLVPGKRSFQVIPEMKGRGNVCENA